MKYSNTVFAFTDPKTKDVWGNIMLILDQNIKVETEIALSPEIQGEKRIHQCGRASSLCEIKDMLISERKKALDIANIDWTTDETLNQ
jgi:hypothetical protein